MTATAINAFHYGDKGWPMAAVAIEQGEIACIDASGYLTYGQVAAGLVALGPMKRSVDNSGGSAGDKVGHVAGSFDVNGGLVAWPMTNATSGDACSQAHVGRSVYITGKNTVANNSNGGARSRAGRLVGFDRDSRPLVVFDLDADASSAPAMQAVNATLASGTITISTGITVASSSEVIPVMIGAITGSTNLAGLRELKASRVNGAPGSGTVVIEAVGADGAKDTDAAGAIRVVILTPQ